MVITTERPGGNGRGKGASLGKKDRCKREFGRARAEADCYHVSLYSLSSVMQKTKLSKLTSIPPVRRPILCSLAIANRVISPLLKSSIMPLPTKKVITDPTTTAAELYTR